MDQEKRRKELYSLMGDLPDRDREITVTKIEESEKDGYTDSPSVFLPLVKTHII